MLTSTDEVRAYLATQTAQTGTVDNPVYLPVQINLGIMTAAKSDWRDMLAAIEEADKYVDLDLSVCTMSGIAFNPGPAVATGKDKIVSLDLPDTATMITGGIDYENPAFKHFTALKIFSGTGLFLIDYFAFSNCESLTMTSLPAGLIYIVGAAFYGCNGLTEITLPEGIIAVNSGVFLDCKNLARISLPERLDTIGSGAFSGCTSLTDISLPEGLTTISGDAFYHCTGLTEITLTAGLIYIGDYAFSGCTNLVLTDLPEGLSYIDEYAFKDCTSLTEITLPEGLSSIGYGTFSGCENLALVTCLAVTPPRPSEGSYLSEMFVNTHSTLRIEVPAESVAAYKAAYGWSDYADRIFAIGDNK
jgi:hypothetical protein